MFNLGALARFTHPVSLVLTGIVGSLLVAEAMPAPNAELMQIRPTTEEVREVNGGAILAIAALGSAGIGIALTAAHELNRPAKQRSAPVRRNPTAAVKVNPQLRRKLQRLLPEDRRIADRLIAQMALKHPGKSTDWYVEKVIYDLQRDRH
jgi:RNA 3'-terminal phosphate cyclase